MGKYNNMNMICWIFCVSHIFIESFNLLKIMFCYFEISQNFTNTDNVIYIKYRIVKNYVFVFYIYIYLYMMPQFFVSKIFGIILLSLKYIIFRLNIYPLDIRLEHKVS